MIKQIWLPLRGRPILLSLVQLQTEMDSTQSCASSDWSIDQLVYVLSERKT